MNAQIALQILLRLLPSILLFATAFYVVKDERMRQRWGEMLFRAGSVSFNDKDDPKIQSGVRTPFLILGALFLLWPLWYLWRDSYAQRPVTVIIQPTPIPKPTPIPTPLPGQGIPTPTPFGTPPAMPNFSNPNSSAPAPVQNPAPIQVPAHNQPVADPTPIPLKR